MKKSALLIILLLSIHLVSASSIFLRDVMEEGQTKIYKIDNGMYILEVPIISDLNRAVKFRLNDDMSDFLKAGESYRFNDKSEIVVNSVTPNEAEDGPDEVNFYFFGSGNNPVPLENVETFNTSTVDLKACNFDGKCEDETQENCCYDCGCKFGFNCINNECVKSEECSKNIDCIDSIACNKDECRDRICIHTDIDGCELNATCFEYGYSTPDQYCASQGWNQRKGPGEECNNDYECFSELLCKENICTKQGNSFWKISGIALLIIALLVVVYLNRKLFDIFPRRKQKIKFKF